MDPARSPTLPRPFALHLQPCCRRMASVSARITNKPNPTCPFQADESMTCR